MTRVLDACALIAWLKKEDGAAVVDDLLNKAEDGKINLCISVVNLVEVYYGFMKDLGEAVAQEIMQTVRETAIKVIDTVDDAVIYEIARLKSTLKGFSLADAFGLATAAIYDGTFVTCDYHDLEKIESQVNIPFLWIRQKPQK